MRTHEYAHIRTHLSMEYVMSGQCTYVDHDILLYALSTLGSHAPADGRNTADNLQVGRESGDVVSESLQ